MDTNFYAPTATPEKHATAVSVPMSGKPILFSAAMVRALLEGRKSQTRRLLKPQPLAAGYYEGDVSLDRLYPRDGLGAPAARFSARAIGGGGVVQETVYFPWWSGERLWVREAWRAKPLGGDRGTKTFAAAGSGVCIEYVAGGGEFDCINFNSPDWRELRSPHENIRPSIHMPRWASRLTLIVTDVRVQRLQEISAQDAFEEGIRFTLEEGTRTSGWGVPGIVQGSGPQHAYSLLWEHLHGAGSWEANPWVAAISFRTIRANIDTPEAQT